LAILHFVDLAAKIDISETFEDEPASPGIANIVNILSENKKEIHCPVRDSKMTHLM
jgi:hypothetical protein